MVLHSQDIRLALRRLRKNLWTTVASIAALACGIGAAVAAWSLLAAVLLKPLSVEAPDRLFQVHSQIPDGVPFASSYVPGHSYPEVEAIRESGLFDGTAAGGIQRMLVTEQGGVPRSREVYFASHDFFATLGIGAARGRTFAENEDRRGALPVAVLSDHYWRSAFDSEPDVLGRTITVSGTTATIIGVLPRGFRGLHLSEAPDVFLPLHVAGDINYELFNVLGDPLGPRMSWIRVVGRLRAGDTPSAVEARLNAVPIDCPVCERVRGRIGPFILTDVNTAAIPFGARAGTTQFASLLFTTVGLLLLIGCLTVGMLLLLRTEDRRDELAMRRALGATRSRLVAGIAVEAAILCALGAAVAVPVALWFFYGVRAFQLPGGIEIERLELTLAPTTWLAAAGTALVGTCVIALLASLAALGTSARSPLQSRAFTTPRVTRQAPRAALVAGQVAITLVLVAGAGLFTRSLIEALSLNAGIETDRIFTATLNLGPHGYTEERAVAFVDELRERLQQNGVIESVSVRQGIGSAVAGVPVAIDGMQRVLPSTLSYMAVESNFFSTIGLPIVGGRGFGRSDITGAPRVAVVSESLGRWVADGGNPIGYRISDEPSIRRVMMGQGTPDYLEIIGVVPDLIANVNATEPLVIYQPVPAAAPVGFSGSTFVLRAAGDSGAAMRETMSTVRALDPRVTLAGVMTLDEQIRGQMNRQSLGIYVLGVLGGTALLQTVLCTFVIAESMVARRRRELSIRAALGAGSTQLRRLVLRDTARLVGMGLIAGLVLAISGTRLIRSQLYRVEPLDPTVLVTSAIAIFALALLVSLRPALEAARVDLTRSLREE